MSDAASDSPAEIESGVPIGIAFGNTTSSIAYTSGDGKAELIANEEGDRHIPTVLSYLDNDEFHGGEAKAQLVRNPNNTVAYFRDFLGKKYSEIDPTNSHYSAHPIDVDGTASFKVVEKTDEPASNISVSEITSRHLRRLHQSAVDFLGKPVSGAVIAVPTDFTEAQRSALVAAAKSVDLQVLQIINEPVAEAFAYSSKETSPSDKNILVVDIGGTRTDAAVIAARGGMYTIIQTAHDYELGGVHLDQVLVDHFAKEFLKKHKTDPRENSRGLAKLKQESEAVKRTLSIATTASIAVDSLSDGFDFHSSVNRLRFELLGKKVFDQIVKLAELVIEKSELDSLHIDEVILAGGSSHIPKIAQRFRQLFPETTAIRAPSTDAAALNPAELSARGAALQANLIGEYEVEDIEQSTHAAVTVVPHLSKDIGVVIVGADNEEQFHPLLPVETAVPARRSAEFNAPAEGGNVLVKIVEGSSEIRKHIPEKQPKAPNGDAEGSDEDDDDDSEEEEEEEEEVKTKHMKIDKLLAEVLLKDVEKGQKVEVSIRALTDGTLDVSVRIVGTQKGVRGQIKKA